MAEINTHVLKDGEVFEVDDTSGETIEFECCDCGLIHRIAFAREKNGQLGVAIERRSDKTKTRRSRVPLPYLIAALKSDLDADTVEALIANLPERYFT